MTSSIIVSALVIRHPRERKLLMVRKSGTTSFMLPGGKPEPGEDPRTTIVREVAEELHVDIDDENLEVQGTYSAPAANEAGFTVTGNVFAYRGLPAGLTVDEPPVFDEIAEARWVPFDPLPDDSAHVQYAPLTRHHVIPNLPSFITAAPASSPIGASGAAREAVSRPEAPAGLRPDTSKAPAAAREPGQAVRRIAGSAVQAARPALRLARSAARVGSELVRARTAERRLPAASAPNSADSFAVGVYFAGDVQAAYQLEQWLWPLEQLRKDLIAGGEYGAEPVGILCRNAEHAHHFAARTQIPVRFSRLTAGMDTFMAAPSLACVLYVNQATANFQGLRYPRPAHVHLSHGESEKISMISNQLKAYDYVFTAGQAARDRLQRALYGFDQAACIDVGRPQVDEPVPIPGELAAELARGTSPAVFVAPTWEGDSPAMAYGTLAESGEALIDGLLERGLRVIFRPHPRTGRVDPAFARALARVKEKVAASPGSVVDTSARVGWQFAAADACVAEMSSLAFDWLTTGKPLVLLKPSRTEAEVLPGGIFERVPAVPATAADAAVQAVADRLDTLPDPELTRYYFGETAPGQQLERFIRAVRTVVRTRTAEWRE